MLACHGEIEHGHAAWGYSFHRILPGHLKSSGTSVPSSATKDSRPVLFCQGCQCGTSNFSNDHSGLLQGEVEFPWHICAMCWVHEWKKRARRQISEQCPLRQTSEVDPPMVSGNSA